MITTARTLLAISALLYVAVGVLVLINPNAMENMGIALVTPTGITTTRTWGALFTGVGLSSLAMAAYRDWLIPGLLLVVVIGFCIVAARVSGMWIDGIEPRQWIELRREGIGFLLGLMGLIIAVVSQRKPQ